MSALVRVLVVDDDRGARALHAGFVAATPGFVVTGTAATGTDALRLAADADLVLDGRLATGVLAQAALARIGARHA